MNDDDLQQHAAMGDEELMAYADDALPLPRASEIRRAAAADPRLAARIAMFRASRDGLAAAFEPVLAEPVPERLLALFDAEAVAAARAGADAAAPASRPSAVRRPQSQPRNRVWPLALAASVLLSVLVSTLHRQPVAPATVAAAASLDALVVAALDRQPSGEPLAEGEPMQREVMPLSTVVADDGRYCRDYETTTLTAGAPPASQRARACRNPDGWVAVEVASVRPDAPVDAYAPASGSAAGRGGQPVDADTEAALIAGGWAAAPR